MKEKTERYGRNLPHACCLNRPLHVLLPVLLCLWLLPGLCVSANDRRVTDGAGLLSASEESALQEQFEEIAVRFQCDLVVVTQESCGGVQIQSFTDGYYEEQEYGIGEDRDGIILLVSMQERQFHLATFGRAISIFTDYGLEVIDGEITPGLSDGDYYEAFRTFGELARQFMQEAQENRPYDTDHRYRAPMKLWARVLISAGAGMLAAAVVLAALYAQLKSVGHKKGARAYTRARSFHVTRANDLFLYRTVTRHKIEQNKSGGGGGSSTHTTPGGTRAGGRTGSF